MSCVPNYSGATGPNDVLKGVRAMTKAWFAGLIALAVLVVLAIPAAAQETTGGLQGTLKDPSGAVVPHALVVVASTSLVGDKEIEADSSGSYRFSNLPPGTYTITVTAKGFRTVKHEGLILEV